MPYFKEGQKVGEYTISQKVGHGKFSDVYSGYIDDPNQLKCIKIQKNNEDSKETSSYEVKVLEEIKNNTTGHDHIIKLLNTFEHDGLICNVYELMGCDVIDFIEDKFPDGMPYEYVHRIMNQLLSAVSFLHKHNLIHTDIKPDNILLSKCPDDIKTVDDIHIFLADFGTAVKYDANKRDYSDHMQTPEYQAPEIIIGHEYDHKIDIWSCICTFYELLTGNYLFDPADINTCDEYSDEYSDDMEDITDKFDNATLSDEGQTDESQTELPDVAMSLVESDEESDDEVEEKMINLIHLYHMDRMLGEMPDSFISEGHYSGYYFTNKNKLRGDLYRLDDDLTLRNFLKNLKVGGNYNRIYDIFSRGLQYIPEKRADADTLLSILNAPQHLNIETNKLKLGKGIANRRELRPGLRPGPG
jgi:serine/threonine protein kinase